MPLLEGGNHRDQGLGFGLVALENVHVQRESVPGDQQGDAGAAGGRDVAPTSGRDESAVVASNYPTQTVVKRVDVRGI